MEIRKCFLLLYLFAFMGCDSSRKLTTLPEADNIDISPFGSYIEVKMSNGQWLIGELLAIDSSVISVLQVDSHQFFTVPVSVVEDYRLKYARSRDFSWTIPVFTIGSALHGALGVFTIPINLITTIIVTASGKNAFTYSQSDMPLNKLKMFARYPQGIPSGIDPLSIK